MTAFTLWRKRCLVFSHVSYSWAKLCCLGCRSVQALEAEAVKVSSLGRHLGRGYVLWPMDTVAQIQLSQVSFWHKTIDQDSQWSDGLRMCPDPVFSHLYTAGVLATEDRKWWRQDMKEKAKTYAGLSGLGAFPETFTGNLSRSLIFAFLLKGNWREQSWEGTTSSP